ncbi:hypothetical protein AeMF1_012617, partial [Aphanomyces euteiches]
MAQDSQGKYQEAVDAPLLEFVGELLSHAANIVCSIQTPGFFGAANQTCGSAWHQSLSYKSADGNVTLDRIRTAMQIPNDQGCAAVLGDAITTTKGQSVANVFAKPVVPGSCVQPVDAFLAWIRQVPFVDTVTWNGVRFRDLFLDGTCVNGTTINRAMVAGFAKSDVDLFYRLIEMTPDDVASMCICVRRFPLPLKFTLPNPHTIERLSTISTWLFTFDSSIMPAFVDNHVFHKGKGGKRVTYCRYCSQSMTSQSKARWEQHMRGCLQCPDDVKQQLQLK